MSVTAKGLNIYDHVIFQFFFNKFENISVFFCQDGVLSVHCVIK